MLLLRAQMRDIGYRFATEGEIPGEWQVLAGGNSAGAILTNQGQYNPPEWDYICVHHIKINYAFGGYCFEIFFDLFSMSSVQFTTSNIIGKLPNNYMPATGHYWQTSASGNAFDDGVVTNIYKASGGAGALSVNGFRASTEDAVGTRASSLMADGTLTDTVQTII